LTKFGSNVSLEHQKHNWGMHMIHVTKSYLPNIDNFKGYIDEIFASGWLTNGGQFVELLQKRLSEHLGVRNLLLFSNGTLALQVAYKLLGLRGDVLTTPFTFVATTSSIVWEGLNPIFVDIDPHTLNLDPAKIEAAITPDTIAIVATHVFGNACDIDAIEDIARRYGLKVIYDAAHAFSVNYKGRDILSFGDVSMISFHSTKFFHTIEGGALVIEDDALYEKAKKMINFGIESPTSITDLGINAKMNEFQAAMGLCVLDEIEKITERRQQCYDRYMQAFADFPGLSFPCQNPLSTPNYSHFPVLFDSEEGMLQTMRALNALDIYPRRYFYPSLETLPYVSKGQQVPISADIAKRILCLPLYVSLERHIQDKIVGAVKQMELFLDNAV
jgi:dTDP-4-amino-4,6-dideoxygalactose transaminase